MPDYYDAHPELRRSFGYNMASFNRRNAEAFRRSAADARLNQMMYERDTGRPAPPGYGYVSPEYMTPAVRRQADQYARNISRMSIIPGEAPNVGRNDAQFTTYATPSGGAVALPTTTDPTKLAMRARMFGTNVPTQRPSFPAVNKFFGESIPSSGAPTIFGEALPTYQEPSPPSLASRMVSNLSSSLQGQPAVGPAGAYSSFFGSIRDFFNRGYASVARAYSPAQTPWAIQ